MDDYMDAAGIDTDAGDDLTRRAIIAAHYVHCVREACGDDVSTYPKLTTREQAIVALWRADVEEKSAEIDDKSRIGHAAADAWMDKAQKAEAAIERALTVHREHTNNALVEHCKCLACDMARALDGTEADHA